jgi:aminopeptidase N
VLGAQEFRKGTDLYFKRHDGQAVTVEDFVQALADASGRDLSGFMQWYRQPGTPMLHVHGEYLADRQEYRLTLRQESPQLAGFPPPRALPVPVRMALLGRDGREQRLQLPAGAATETVLLLQEAEQTFIFTDIAEAPVPSLLRNFSAPVRVQHALSLTDKLFLLRHDGNGFNRWLTAQDLLCGELLRLADDSAAGRHLLPDAELLTALSAVVAELGEGDPALAVKLLQLPGLLQLIDSAAHPDPDALHMARECFRHALTRKLEGWLLLQFERLHAGDYRYDAAAIAGRSLRNTALAMLVDLEPGYHALATAQIERSRHMSDESAALVALVHADSVEAPAALERFAGRWQHEALVMDQWFAMQATAPLLQTVQRVSQLREHADFHRDNPNRVRALIGQFAGNNPRAFHQKDGSGYCLLVEEIGKLDAINPQVAARLLGSLSSWRRFDADRQHHAQACLGRLSSLSLSPDVRETLQRLCAVPASQA